MSGSRSILIVGGGVIGLCTAWYALQKGHRVTILERNAPDHQGCSLGNAGMIVPSHFVPLAAPGMAALGLRMLGNPRSPFFIRPRLSWDLLDWGWKFLRASHAGHVARSAPLLRDLNLASRCAYEELAERFDNRFELTRRGLLMLCKTQHGLEEEAKTAEQAQQLGLTAEVLTPAQAAQRDPGIRMDIAGAIYFAQDCHLTPQKFYHELTQALQQNGADLRWQSEVIGWQAKGGRILAARTREADFTADEYVLAGGSWSPGLARDLGLRLPMQAGKGYSITLPNPRYRPTLCSILMEARVAVTPMGESLRFGGTMELGGLDESIQKRRVEGILASIPRYFPDFRAEDFRSLPIWQGLRPCSPDGLPYIGRFGSFANLSTATGHAMMGLSLAPITGQLMAAVLSGEQPSIAMSALSPDRYAMLRHRA